VLPLNNHMDKFHRRIRKVEIQPKEQAKQPFPMKPQLGFRGKIFLCGLPRSGTTILTRLLAGFDGVEGLSEPWLKEIQAAESNNPEILVVKQVYRSDHTPYPAANDKICEQFFSNKEYTKIFLIRNPHDVWQSQKRACNYWANDGWNNLTLNNFIKNSQEFHQHVRGIVIDYDALIADPSKELSLKTKWSIEGRPILGPIAFSRGDEGARQSTTLKTKPKVPLDEEERNALAGLYDIWNELKKKTW